MSGAALPYIQIAAGIRVEAAPVTRVGVATTWLLTKGSEGYRLGAPDALGKVIKLGEPMTYLDWLGKPVWRVYVEQAASDGVPRYLPVSEWPTREEAITKAEELRDGRVPE